MKKTKNYAMPYPEQDDYFNVEDFQNMMVSVDNLMKKLSDSGAQISSDAEHLYNQTKAQMDNIQKRMNTFTSLKDGSTTGDAELTDIRVAYDGKEYGNAGEAVREQASDMHKALFGAGASIWSKAKSESTKYVVETKGICILNERFTAAGVVTKISRGTFAENESTLNLDRECSAYIVEFEKNPGTVYMPSAETIKIVSTTKIIFEANGNARCWIPVEKGQYLAVDSTATAYTSESNHVPYMLYDQANKTLECRGFGSTGSIEPVAPYSLALEYKLEYDMDDTGLVKQIDANREAAVSLKEDISDVFSDNIFDVSKCIKGKAYATTYNVSTLEDFVDNEKAYSVPAITLPYGGKITVNQKYNWSSFVAYLYKNNIYQGYITPVQNDNGTWTFTNNMDGCDKIAFTILSGTADFDISKFMVVIGDYDKMPDIYEPSGLKVPEKSIQFDALTDNCVNKIISQANSATGSNKKSRTVIYDNGLGNKVINATVGNKIEFVNYAYRTLYSIDVEESGYYITNVRSQNTGSNSWAVVDKNDIVLSCGEAEVEKVGVHIPKISGMKKIYWTNEKGITSIFKDNEKYEVYSGDKILYTISEENCTHSGIDNVNYFSCSSDAAITLGIENTYGTSLGIWIYVPYDSTKLIENINVETYKNGAKVHERYIGKQHFELGAWQFVKINIQDGYIDSIKLTVSGTRTTSAVIGIKNVLIVDQFSKPIVIINNDSAWQSSDTCGFYDYLINNKIPWTITGTLENVNENTKSKLLSAYKDNLLDIGLYGNENYNDVNYSINDGTPDYQTMQRNMDEVMDKKLDYCDNPISFGARGHNYNPKILRCIKNNGFKIWKTCASNLYSNCEFADTISGIGITTQPMSGWFDYAVSPSVGGCTLGLFTHGISETPSGESDPNLYYSWATVKERLDTLLQMRNRGNVEFMNMAQFYKLVIKD